MERDDETGADLEHCGVATMQDGMIIPLNRVKMNDFDSKAIGVFCEDVVFNVPT